MQEMLVRSLGREDLLEEEMATHSSIFCLEDFMDEGSHTYCTPHAEDGWPHICPVHGGDVVHETRKP